MRTPSLLEDIATTNQHNWTADAICTATVEERVVSRNAIETWTMDMIECVEIVAIL